MINHICDPKIKSYDIIKNYLMLESYRSKRKLHRWMGREMEGRDRKNPQTLINWPIEKNHKDIYDILTFIYKYYIWYKDNFAVKTENNMLIITVYYHSVKSKILVYFYKT